MFEIYGNRNCFYQWDVNQKLIVKDTEAKEIHFCNRTSNCALVCEVYQEGGLTLVNVPNILLTESWDINAYCYCNDNYTKQTTKFKVLARSKPADYVYTETEVKSWEDLAQQIEVAAGQKTEQGGEIFNNYKENKAVSEYSSAAGSKNIAGVRGFNILSISPAEYKSIKLDSVDGLEQGDIISIITAKVALDYATITAVHSGTNEIQIDKYLDFTLNTMEITGASYNYLFVANKPNIGTEDLSEYAYANGYNNKALGKAAHAEGANNIASGWYSHTEGRGNKATDYNAHAEGRQTEATANAAHAEGRWTKANGIYSHAEGAESQAIGSTSHAEGGTTKAIGNWAHSEGHETQAIGDCSHAEGDKTEAKKGAHSEGYNTKAYGEFSHAEGYEAKANGNITHAEGYGTIADGNQSHAEGYLSYTKAPNAHAEGYGTKVEATAEAAHTEGVITVATGTGAHAEGYFTRANGTYSHSQGYNTQANANYSHAGGLDTIATAEAQTVVGKSNATNNNALFIVGNGTQAARKNAFEVLESGAVVIGGITLTADKLQKLLALV